MSEAYIIDAIRTPRGKGKKDGSLHEVKPITLLTTLLNELKDRHQLEAGIGPDAHEGARAERDLPAVAGEDVQPHRRKRVDQERKPDRVEIPLVDQERNDHECREQDREDRDPVLSDGEDGLVGGVARLELACLAVEHSRFSSADLVSGQW